MEAGVTDSEEEVLVVMDLADLSHVSEGGASVQASEGRVDLRIEVFLVEETSVASVIVVSAGAISGDRRFGRFGPDFFGFGFNGFGFPYYPYYAYPYYYPYYRYPYYYPYPY